MPILEYGQALNNAPNPMQGFMQSANQAQGLMNNAQVMNQRGNQNRQQEQDRIQAQQAAVNEQAIRQEASELMLSNDFNAQAQFMIKNPAIRKQFIDTMKFKDDAAISERANFNKSVLASSGDPRPMLQAQIEKVEARGGDTENLKLNLELGSDEEIRAELRKELNFIDTEAMIKYNEATGAGKPMSEYEGLMIENRKADHKISILKIQQANAKTELQNDKLQQEITKLEDAKEKRNKDADLKDINLDFEFQAVQDEGQGVLDLLDKIENHEGLNSAVGLKGPSSLFGLMDEPIAGTAAADVVALIQNLEAKNFITAVGIFKAKGGSGSLSDNEGKQLSASLSNLSRAQSPESFKESLAEVRRLIKLGMTRMKEKQVAQKGGVPKQQINVLEMTDEDLFN